MEGASGLVGHFRAMARNNAWSNRRLYDACLRLSPEAFTATRTSFFPSISLTLNHILEVDLYYLDGLEDGGRGASIFETYVPDHDARSLWAAQAAADRRLIAFCDGVTDEGLARTVHLDRGRRGKMPDPAGGILAHLFVHQIHHRGQVHAMLSGTDVKPPQLDEYFLAEDHRQAGCELADIGLAR
ncbi:MAG TPA: DinB family protein [Azospirillaceae bacterium]|nr:DinB family protein [Azospirillaceae bacterium]